MGIGFTIDTPAKVAHYGISSVISLVDDILIDKMRGFYSKQLNIPFRPISEKEEDHRAKRITAYLNLIDMIVHDKFAKLKHSIEETGEELHKYIDMLPDGSAIAQHFHRLPEKGTLKEELREWIHTHLQPGSIDVNIMTKLDKENYRNDEKLPATFNDAHAALRGYAQSTLRSSIVFSAGMNPRLYGYAEAFDDFYPDEQGNLKKKITLKVSDYRSALIQGKFLAKKGLWVSEYRIESGLNCGGHAFATDGYLLGPILEEFKINRASLIQTTYELFAGALKNKNRPCPPSPLPVRVTAQGGVGTAEEHQLLLEHYELDSVGWGSPFLLVQEVTNVDPHTLELLCNAREDDIYLSNISPLGVPFNTLKNNTKDIEKQESIDKGHPGSSCPKKYVSLNTEFTDRPICLASREYQHLKIKQLDEQNLSVEEYKKEFDAITEKSCICVGLGTAALLVNDASTRVEGPGVSICPGPNLAYFDKAVSLKEMVDHIYGRTSLVNEETRPHMFLKELRLYVDYIRQRIDEAPKPLSEKQLKYFQSFQQNLQDGIGYYQDLFSELETRLAVKRENILRGLEEMRDELCRMSLETSVTVL
ncbi:MAG: hypothetical protein HY033_00190 [Ignavibacteriae bacterium]|nr:hypothetical protein [Ignavibacteria bacterium]MBI3363307.1 hypothetical protein [Ignavibacteriota bacterium]